MPLFKLFEKNKPLKPEKTSVKVTQSNEIIIKTEYGHALKRSISLPNFKYNYLDHLETTSEIFNFLLSKKFNKKKPKFDLKKYLEAELEITKTRRLLIKLTHFNEVIIDLDSKRHLAILNNIKVDIVRLYIKYKKPFELNIRNAKFLSRSPHTIKIFDQYNSEKSDAFLGLMSYIKNYIKHYMLFCKQLPGIESLNSDDFFRLIRINFPLMFIWSLLELSITKDCFLISEGIQMNKKCLADFLDDETCKLFFEYQNVLKTLDLNEKEMGILMAFLLTYLEPCNVLILLFCLVLAILINDVFL